MKTLCLAGSGLLLSACVYSETPYGTYARIDLPIHNQTTINKTVTVNAPAGTTVIMSDNVPVSAYGQGYVDCRHHHRQSHCYQRPLPPPKPVYRLQGQGGNISRSVTGFGYAY